MDDLQTSKALLKEYITSLGLTVPHKRVSSEDKKDVIYLVHCSCRLMRNSQTAHNIFYMVANSFQF